MKKSGRILLDTNIISDLNSNKPSAIAALQNASEVFTTVISIGEIFYAIENSTRREEILHYYRAFFNQCAILDITAKTAEVYGHIKSDLKRQGTPIPENDIWIAALTVQYNVQLVTRDRHFKHIESLDLNLIH